MNNFSVKELKNIDIQSRSRETKFNSLSFWKVEVGPDGDIVQAYYSWPKVNPNKIILKKMTEVFVVPRNGMEYVNPHRARAFLDVLSSYIRVIK